MQTRKHLGHNEFKAQLLVRLDRKKKYSTQSPWPEVELETDTKILSSEPHHSFWQPEGSKYGRLDNDEYEIQATMYPYMLVGMRTYTQKYDYEHVAQ